VIRFAPAIATLVLATPIATPIARALASPDAGDGSGSGSAAPEASTAETPPEILHQEDPVYPDLPPAQRLVVDVHVHVSIDATGVPSNPVVTSAANPAFDDLAISDVLAWTFSPARHGDQAVASALDVVVHFDPKAHGGGEVVTVEGHVRKPDKPPDRGTATFDLATQQMSSTARASASKMLEQAPGLFLANEGGLGHADQVFLRGFDAEQGQDIEFTVNGVPINEVDNTDGHGYADTHFIIPEVVKTLRVTEGPFDPHQGDFAVAGSAEYELGVVDRGERFEQTVGSYGTTRTLALWAPASERDGTFGAVSIFNTAGYGTNRADTAASAMSQYEGTLGASGLWQFLVTAYGTHYKSAGVVRADDVADGKVGFYGSEDPSQGGDAQRYTASFTVQNPVDGGVMKQQLFLTYRTLDIIEDFTGFLLDNPAYGQSPHPQRGDAIEQDYTALTVGARGSYKLTGKIGDLEQSAEVGYYARYDHTDPEIQRLRFGTTIPYLVDEDLTTDVFNIAPYLDVNLKPLPWLTLRGGLRQEFFSYDVLNACATDGAYKPGEPLDVLCPAFDSAGPRQPDTRVTATGTITEPKATVLVQLPAGLQATGSVGVGAQSLDAVYISENQNAPFSQLTAAEAGVLFSHGVFLADHDPDSSRPDIQITARAIGYYTHVGLDLIFDPLQGRLSESTGTSRDGVVLVGQLASSWFNELASFTYAYATFDDTHALVPYVPDIVARSDTSVVHALPWQIDGHALVGRAGVGLNYVGSRALPLGQFSAPTFTIDASAGVRWRFVDLGVQAFNLLDTKYALTEYFYASDFHNGPIYPTLAPTLNFTAAPPLTVLFTLGLRLGKDGK
jgi:TonB family protein